MFIDKIILDNYRIYKNSCKIEFSQDEHRNVYIVSGNNGFGKTSFLTSLVWCFYGKNMIDVENKFREDVYYSGGYKKYANSNLNNLARNEGCDSYNVSVTLSDIFIPSIPCEKVEIIRSYDVSKNEETLKILVDGSENELTKEVGNEIFINDFILPREIAKFFFFDAEKIVSLAEVTSIDEKKSLSKAYSEVLGIKKYEDLKENLQDLRTRLRRNNASDDKSNKLGDLKKDIEKLTKINILNLGKIDNLKEELSSKILYSNQLQERLIREGNSLSLEALNLLKEEIKNLNLESEKLKASSNELMELAPLAICSNLLVSVNDQILLEELNQQSGISIETKKELYRKFSKEIKAKKYNSKISTDLLEIIHNTLFGHEISNKLTSTLLGFDQTEKISFYSILNKLKFSYSQNFREIGKAYRNNRSQLNKLSRKLTDAESKENDLLIQQVREEKTKIDYRIQEIYKEIASIEFIIESAIKEITSKQKVVSEIVKKIQILDQDIQKDDTAARLINQLQTFIGKLKVEKKVSLEDNIKIELNRLMHKKDFINHVNVRLENELIDIDLFKKNGVLIDKEKLSKGEQQLYATALLKALVSESNIKFPVFIDSPLQKFDKVHSDRVIVEFYPTISKQVVLFPLLEKELSEAEFTKLSKKIAGCFLIKNIEGEYSYFEKIETKFLFNSYKKEYDTVG